MSRFVERLNDYMLELEMLIEDIDPDRPELPAEVRKELRCALYGMLRQVECFEPEDDDDERD